MNDYKRRNRMEFISGLTNQISNYLDFENDKVYRVHVKTKIKTDELGKNSQSCAISIYQRLPKNKRYHRLLYANSIDSRINHFTTEREDYHRIKSKTSMKTFVKDTVKRVGITEDLASRILRFLTDKGQILKQNYKELI